METPEHQPMLMGLFSGIPEGKGFRPGNQSGVVKDDISVYFVEKVC